MNTVAFVGSFTTATGDEERTTACVYEPRLILRDLINDKSYLIYAFWNAADGLMANGFAPGATVRASAES